MLHWCSHKKTRQSHLCQQFMQFVQAESTSDKRKQADSYVGVTEHFVLFIQKYPHCTFFLKQVFLLCLRTEADFSFRKQNLKF